MSPSPAPTRRAFLSAFAATLAWPTASRAAPAGSRRRPPPPRDPSRVALVGGRVLLGDGRELPEGVVEFDGARLVRVAEGGATPGFRVVDVRGKVVTPGLIAGLSRLGLLEIEMEDATRDDRRTDDDPVHAAFDVAPAVHAGSSLIPVTAIDGFTSAIAAPAGGLIAGRSALLDLLPWDHRGIVARPRVAMHGSLGRVVQGSRAATLAHLRRVLADARLYRSRRGAYDRRQVRDLAAHPADLAALAPVLDREIPLVLGAHRASDILAAIALARQERLRLVLVGCAQGWQVATELAAAEIPVIVQPSHNLPRSLDELGATMENAARMHAAGVELGIAVLDEPHNVRNATQEAGVAVANGLPRQVALQALTSTLARIYGVDDLVGTLARGKAANVVVWPGDPFELGNWPEQVYVRGRALPMRSRQTLLRDRYRDLSGRRP